MNANPDNGEKEGEERCILTAGGEKGRNGKKLLHLSRT